MIPVHNLTDRRRKASVSPTNPASSSDLRRASTMAALAPYSISISNKSGEKQSYAIFAEAPVIKTTSGSAASASIKFATRIITSVRGVSHGHGMASFILSRRLYASCGTYDVDSDEDGDDDKSPVGTGTEVIDQRPVTLGKLNAKGKLVPGTLLEVDSSGGSPSFVQGDPEAAADVDCFAIRARADFTAQEARLSE
jgi:hypothetical protein